MSETDPAWYEFRNAVYAREFARAQEMLTATPSLIHLTNGLGETALHFLAVENDEEGVARLHARGASLDTKNMFGDPVLFEVASLGYKELFVWFSENGANLKVTNREDEDVVIHLLNQDNEEVAEWVRRRDV